MVMYEVIKKILQKQLKGAEAQAQKRLVKRDKELEIQTLRKKIRTQRKKYTHRKTADWKTIKVRASGIAEKMAKGADFLGRLGENYEKNTKKRVKKRTRKYESFF